jgi:hypothetical protein
MKRIKMSQDKLVLLTITVGGQSQGNHEKPLMQSVQFADLQKVFVIRDDPAFLMNPNDFVLQMHSAIRDCDQIIEMQIETFLCGQSEGVLVGLTEHVTEDRKVRDSILRNSNLFRSFSEGTNSGFFPLCSRGN